jgi:uncharacterized membrane protein YgcG
MNHDSDLRAYTISLVAAACFLASSGAVYASPDEDAWDMVATKIHAFLVGNDKDFDKTHLIQLPTVPVYADWTDKKYLYPLYMIADSVPKWGPVWFPTNKTFSDAYRQFAYSLALPAPTPAKEAQAKAYVIAAKSYSDAVSSWRNDWLKFDAKQKHDHPNQTAAWVSKQNWYSDNAAPDLSTRRDAMLAAYVTYQNGLDATTRILGMWTKKIDEVARIDIRMPISAEQFNADENDPTSWTTEPRLPVKFNSTALATLVADGKAQFQTSAPAVTWTFDSGADHSSISRSSWSASASYGPFFNGSVNHSQTSIDLSKQGTFVKFGYYALAQIPIGPTSNWYTQALITNYACGPFKPDSHTTPADWWGEHGRLGAVPVSVIVAYRPVLEAMLTSEQYSLFESATSGSGGLSIGPFSVGGGGSSFSQTIDKHWNNGHVLVTSQSDTPMVVAVVYEKLPGKMCP